MKEKWKGKKRKRKIIKIILMQNDYNWNKKNNRQIKRNEYRNRNSKWEINYNSIPMQSPNTFW